MKILAWLVLLLATAATATNYTVKAGGGGNYTTIAACAAAAVNPGDTCTVFQGDYAENVTLSHSGTGTGNVCTACITFTVNPGDTVTSYRFSISGSYVVVNGFTLTDPTLAAVQNAINFAAATTGVHITNNTITQIGTTYPCIAMPTGASLSSYTVFDGNNISWCSAKPGQTNLNATTGMSVYGHYMLAQNNIISHTANGIGVTGDHIVLRNNYYGPVTASTDFGPQQNHVDYVEVGAMTNLLIENNSQISTLGVGGAHCWLMQNTADSYAIMRFNTIYYVGAGCLDAEYDRIKEYNETISQDAIEAGGLMGNFGVSSTNGSYYNNLIYNSAKPAGSKQPYYASTGTGFTHGYNLAFDSSCGPPSTIGNCTNGLMFSGTGNVWGDPLFVNPASDWHLQAGSPAIGAGTSLTAVAATDSESGIYLIVDDAAFFQDGFGITGVEADWVRVGASATAQISSINYTTNTITLVSGIARSIGDPVYLYKDSSGTRVLYGSAPDIGAYPYIAVVANPQFSPPGATYGPSQNVSLSTTPSGPTICYVITAFGATGTPTTDGNGTCTGGTQTYSTPIEVTSSERITAIGTAANSTDSSTVFADYTIGVYPKSVTKGGAKLLGGTTVR